MLHRLSEQRVHDLLDRLCNDVSKTNMLYTSKEGNQSWAKLAEPDWTAPSKPEEDGDLPSQPGNPADWAVASRF